jgi:hypothetical protein
VVSWISLLPVNLFDQSLRLSLASERWFTSTATAADAIVDSGMRNARQKRTCAQVARDVVGLNCRLFNSRK